MTKMNKPDISIRVVTGESECVVNTFRNEYRSLMSLIQDKLCPDGFGECGGMGRCATCRVQLKSKHTPVALERNEQSTLSRSGICDPSIRLSCQLLIEPALHDSTVILLD